MADVKRKTANLFSDKLIGMTWWDGVIVADERFTLHIAEVKPDTTYTASGNNSVDNIMVTYYSVYPAEGQSSVESVRYVYPTDPTRSVATFTTPDDIRIKYAAVRFGSDATDVMFNLGSTALPYEPYGWVHSLRKLGTSTDTITTLPADLYADGTAATIGLKGNMSQTGTPTPTNPIQPEETGERTGNLFDADNAEFGKWVNSNGSIATNATYAAGYDIKVGIASGFAVKYYGDKPYSYSMAFYDSNDDFLTRVHRSNPSASYDAFSVPENAVSARFQVAVNTSDVMTREILKAMKLMLNLGSEALPYEPYGYKIPISSANTTTPVYLGEVETTRLIGMKIFDGSEAWGASSNNVYYTQDYITNGYHGYVENGDIICTHYAKSQTPNAQMPDKTIKITGASSDGYTTSRIYLRDTAFSSAAEVQAFMAAQYANGTPICVWYVLATPETAVVNEPLRKIGDYADTVSGITIPTITGKDTFDVLTTLKPSEVSLAYTGWHDAQSVHEKSRNLWDEDYTGININAIYRPLFVGDGVFTLSTDFKTNQGITDIFLLSGNVSSGISSSTNGAYEGKNITAQSVNGYITIAYRANARAGSGSLPYCKTMLNTGSTALPYEPYWT